MHSVDVATVTVTVEGADVGEVLGFVSLFACSVVLVSLWGHFLQWEYLGWY